MTDKVIKLIEVANTWQGEGPNTGRRMLLVRFKRCQFDCFFCDTYIKMSTSFEGEFSIKQINDALKETKGLMITGGEPCAIFPENNNFEQTLTMLQKCNYEVANIETNGANIQKLINEIDKKHSKKDIKIIYSPKIFNDLIEETEFEKITNIIKHPKLYLKIVATNNNTISLCKSLAKYCNDYDLSKDRIYLMPLGTTKQEIDDNWKDTINLADYCNFNLSTRLHILHDFI